MVINGRTRALLMGVLAVLLLGTGLVSAQPRNTQVWVQDLNGGTLYLVGRGGQEDELVLPTVGDFSALTSGRAAISGDGQRIAYTLTNPATGDLLLVVYDYPTRAIILTYAPGVTTLNSIDLSQSFAFDADGSRLAFGYGFEDASWELVLLDLRGMGIAATLRSSDPAAGDARGDGGYGLIPVPLHTRADGTVGFAMIQGFTEGWPEYAAYIWNSASGTVTPTLGYVSPDRDIFPLTGEVIMALDDSALPGNDDSFMFGHTNALQAYNADLGVRVTFYHDGVNSLVGPRFAYNGESVLALETIPAPPEVDTVSNLVLLDRLGGKLLTVLPNVRGISYTGTPEGFALIAPDGDLPALRFVDVRSLAPVVDLAESLVWRGVPGVFYAIQWAGVLGEANPYRVQTFAGWNNLTGTSYDVDLLIGMGATTGGSTGGTGGATTVTPAAALEVGGTATVRTTGGDSLNMRSAAGTEFAILQKLSSGTLLLLLEGPVSAGSYQWWRVQAPDGQQGWVVESADGVPTLIPGRSASTGEVDETLEGAADPSLPSLLAIGSDAIVTLPNPRDSLRLRNAPGLEGRIIVLLPNGTRLRVIDGPRAANGYTWWQLRTPEGNVGWSAEVIGDDRVLIGAVP
jgi:hypothetical protein